MAIQLIFVFVADFFSNLLCLAQAYEWAIMINMIIYQNGKNLSEIMYLMSEFKSREKFRNVESKITFVYYIIAGIVLIEQIFNIVITTHYNDT
jgi:hypothetical protein